MQNKISSFLQDIKATADRDIEAVLQNDSGLIDGLIKSASYSVAGGKRIRAVFTHLVGQLFDVKAEKLHKAAAAVEMIHAASLIMDDLPYMDDSQLRRGKPANHVVFGQDVALCASIALLSEATALVLDDDSLTIEEQNKVTRVLTESYGFSGLAAGQYVDLKLKRKNVDYSIIEFINAKKTAALFVAAGKTGAMIGNATEAQTAAIVQFSENLGFAFQIIDDILDVEGDSKVIGKDTDHDKMNFVMLVGRDEAERKAAEYSQRALDALNIFGDKADALRALSEFLLKRIS